MTGGRGRRRVRGDGCADRGPPGRRRGVGEPPGIDVGLGDRRTAPRAAGGGGSRVPASSADRTTAPALGSLTATEVTVTVPVSCTRNDQRTVSPRSVFPSPLTSVTAADLVSCRPELWSTGVSAVDGLEVTGWPCGSTAAAVAVLVTTPASTSVWMIVWTGHRAGHRRPRSQRPGRGRSPCPADGSLTETELSVVVPVFLTLQRPGDLVAEVDLEVAVDVGRWSRSWSAARSRSARSAWSPRPGSTSTGLPRGSLPTAVAVLVTEPASTSAWVTTWAPDVQVVVAPGAERCHGARDRAGRRVVHRDARDRRRADVRDQERPGDPVAEVGLAVAVDVGHGGRSC